MAEAATGEFSRVDSGEMLRRVDLTTAKGVEEAVDYYADTALKLDPDHPDKPTIRSRTARLYLVAAFAHPDRSTERQQYIEASHRWATDVPKYYPEDYAAGARREAHALLAVIAAHNSDFEKAGEYLTLATDGVSPQEQPFEAKILNRSSSQLKVDKNRLLSKQRESPQTTEQLSPSDEYLLQLFDLAIAYNETKTQIHNLSPLGAKRASETKAERAERDKDEKIALATNITKRELAKRRGLKPEEIELTPEQIEQIREGATADEVLLRAGIDRHSKPIHVRGLEPNIISRMTVKELEKSGAKFLPSTDIEYRSVYDTQGNLYTLIRQDDNSFVVKSLAIGPEGKIRKIEDIPETKISRDEFMKWEMEVSSYSSGTESIDYRPAPEPETNRITPSKLSWIRHLKQIIRRPFN